MPAGTRGRKSRADEVPEGCVWTVPELFSWVAAREHVDRPEQRKHVQTHKRASAGVHEHAHVCGQAAAVWRTVQNMHDH